MEEFKIENILNFKDIPYISDPDYGCVVRWMGEFLPEETTWHSFFNWLVFRPTEGLTDEEYEDIQDRRMTHSNMYPPDFGFRFEGLRFQLLSRYQNEINVLLGEGTIESFE
jgi:hypothetical protein